MAKRTSDSSADDLRGVSQLVIDATTGITDLVEAMHRNIARVPVLTPSVEGGRTTGITGLVYRAIRGVTGVVGGGIEGALALAGPALGKLTDVPVRDAIVAALNGVLGDHLVATKNPLALPMKFRQNGVSLTDGYDALATLPTDVTGKVVLLIHGLCMNDLQWRTVRTDGSKHDHGAALQRDLGFTPVYLRYNSGLHISTNGRTLSEMLEAFVAAWPSPITQLVIIAHSMGGLVTRSAYQYANEAGHGWTRRVKKIVFLGTPHQGAPLERGGHWIDVILGATPYASPFAKLGKIRSSGITDLRHGSLCDEDWQDKDRFARGAMQRRAVPLPPGVKCLTIAATTGSGAGDLKDILLGDGLVPLASALGQHADPTFALQFPLQNQVTLYQTNHMQLLSVAPAYEAMKAFLT